MSFVLDHDHEENLSFAHRSPITSRATKLNELSFVVNPESDRWDAATEDLTRIQKYKDDWDGEGSEAPRREIVASSMKLLKWFQVNGFNAPDRVLCTVNSNIAFEWQDRFGYMKFEVVSPGRAIWTKSLPGQREAIDFELIDW